MPHDDPIPDQLIRHRRGIPSLSPTGAEPSRPLQKSPAHSLTAGS